MSRYSVEIPAYLLIVGEGIFLEPPHQQVHDDGRITTVSNVYESAPDAPGGVRGMRFTHTQSPSGETLCAEPFNPGVVRFSRITRKGPEEFLGVINRP